MKKGIIIKAPALFTEDEKSKIKEQFQSEDIETTFFSDDHIQASFDSLFQILLNNEFVKGLIIGVGVDILKDIISKIVSKMKKKKVMIIDEDQDTKPAKLTIKSQTSKGTIYLEIPTDISDFALQESIEKISAAKNILDNNKKDGINDLYIIEDKFGNLSIMTLIEFINYKKNNQ